MTYEQLKRYVLSTENPLHHPAKYFLCALLISNLIKSNKDADNGHRS